MQVENVWNGEKSLFEAHITNWCISTIDARNLYFGGICPFSITLLHFNHYINHKRNHINIWRFQYLQYSEISIMLLAYPLICWGSIACQRLRNLGPQTSRFNFGYISMMYFLKFFHFIKYPLFPIYTSSEIFAYSKFENLERNIIWSEMAQILPWISFFSWF